VIQALGDASNAFEASRNGLNASLNDALNRLHAISVVSPVQVRIKAVEFLNTLTARQAALHVLKGETDHNLGTLANDKTSLAERITKVLKGMNQVTLGPRSDLETLLGKVNQLSLPNSEIMKALSETETLLSGLIQEANFIISNLDNLIGGNPQAPSLAEIVSHLNEAKGKDTNFDITSFVQGLMSQAQFKIKDFQTSFRTLFLQFTGSIDELLSSFVASRQVSINNLAASRNRLSTVEPLLSKKHSDLTSQISGLLDPDVRGAFQKSLDSLGGELTIFKDLLMAKSGDLEGLAFLFAQFAAQAPDFASIKTWINSSALLNESISSLESKISTLVNAKKLADGNGAQSIDLAVDTLNVAIIQLTSTANQLRANLEALENKISEAFKEQTEQGAQEQALNQNVDQLEALFRERENMMNLLFPNLLKQKNSIEVLLSELAPLIGGLAKFVPDVSRLATDSAALKGKLENLQPSMSKVSSDFLAAEELLKGLEIARTELNQTHSLLSLRQAKDLLGTTQATFQKTDTVTIFENEMIAHEKESGRIKDSLKTAFLVLSQEREDKLRKFISDHLDKINSLEVRMNQSASNLKLLRSQILALEAEIEALENFEIQETLLKTVHSIHDSLNQIETLLSGAQELIPELTRALIPAQNALDRVIDITDGVRMGNLFTVSMVDELEVSRLLLDTFPGTGASDPFLGLHEFSSSTFLGLFSTILEGIALVNGVLHPPIVQAEIELTHFVIEALRGFKENEVSKEEFKLTIFGFPALGKTRALEIQEQEQKEKEEEEREYRKRTRRFLVLQDFLERERQDDLQVSRRLTSIPVTQPIELQASEGTKPKMEIEPALGAELKSSP